jgi:thiol:disulfide interchange protein DsbC
VRMNWIRNLYALSLCLALSTATADEAKPLSKEELAGKLNGVDASQISDSPVAGIYQVAIGSTVAYVTKDGRYVFQGDITDVASGANITEETRARARVAMLAAVEPATMIVFSPKDGKVKHTVTIFTDVDCGYCRQFHRDIDKVTALGIEVHYLSFPRTGPNTESWAKAEGVWCSKDRNTALTRAKLGGEVPQSKCGNTPVESHYSLGKRIGVRGTPAVFTETGDYIGGYLPPATLAKVLDDPTAVITDEEIE